MQVTLLIPALTALTAMGCFAVQEVDVNGKAVSPRVTLDDFNDGDLVPSSGLFDAWDCYQFNPEPSVPNCSLVSEPDGTDAYSLSLDLTGPPAPTDAGIGAGMSLLRRAGTVDLSAYKHLHVRAKVDVGSPPLPTAAKFEIGIVCTTVNGGSGSGTWLPMVVRDYTILDEFQPANDWRSLTVGLHELTPPDWLKTQTPSASDCLKVVDIIHFEVSSSFDVDQHGTGSLAIDDVWLE